jgi:hypothetical protein
MKVLSRDDVVTLTAANLGVEPKLLFSSEGISAALRRAAGYRCPCTRADLIQAVREAFTGLAPDTPRAPEDPQAEPESDPVDSALEALVAHGDILEEWDIRGEAASSVPFGSRRVLLYAGHPRFVWRDPARTALILGIVPDHRSPVDAALDERIQNCGHLRALTQMEGEDLPGRLEALGLARISEEAWMRSPRPEPAPQRVQWARTHLKPAPGGLETFRILDPRRPVRFYRDRWVVPSDQSGLFVARRPQGYGSDLWLVVQMEKGNVTHVLDLPTTGSRLRGCDEAWHLQAAIDAAAGNPQVYRVRTAGAHGFIDLFAPLPAWAQRRFDLFGTPAPREDRGPGSLFTYRFMARDVDSEAQFLQQFLWMAPLA